MSKQNNKDLVPALRFPEFLDAGEWGEEELGKLLDYLQPTKYLVSSTAYKDTYATPVLTAGKTFILGYTDEEDGIFSDNLPVIIFDDFTTSSKFVDFPFKAKSSAMKMLVAKDNTNIKFVFETMQNLQYKVGVHERHWISIFSKLKVPIPKNSQEQQKIADCLSSLDELIAAHIQKHQTLQSYKKGLMQNLFPVEGKTDPALRFPEFRDADEWQIIKLDKLGELVSGLTYSPKDVRGKGLLVLRSSNVQNGIVSLEDNVYVRPDIKGANLSRPNDILVCVRNGSKPLIGKNALIPEGLPLCTHGAFMTVFRAKNPRFVFQLFQTNTYTRQVAADLGATINSINGNQFKKYEFCIPTSEEEKQKVAGCLSSIDDVIAAQAQKVEELKIHKKGLMQRLFPIMDEVGV